ncbi:MAG: glutamyl-tRNA reductase [Anaerolineae bacterium]|nr:glutamyl-tRNA reductase [Anaerolineales bacterium]MCQ3977557.1 glutamyl-tRNA reductase [Anaerolineae bacterium]
MKILLIGLSHKTAPVEVREKLTFTHTMLRSALTHFDHTHPQAHLEDVREGVILSTCNRLEVYALVRDAEVAEQAVIDFLGRACTVPPALFREHLYVSHDEAAVRHLFRVAAGLDSMVLGEPQILGQITEAYEAALSQGAAGTVLSALFRAAIHTGKRVRTETAISVNPASISSVAAALANQLLGDLSERQVLLIGAGEMGAIAVRALQRRGVSKIVVANRTYKNAEQLAKAWGGQAITFQQLPEALIAADIVISSTGAPHTVLNRELLEPAMAVRPNRPLFMIDIAVPRDIDPNVTEIRHVHLCDIDDLQGQAEDNVRERAQEIPRVEAIVTNELAGFLDWLASLDVVSTITDLRRQIEAVRQRELERLFNRLDLNEHERELIATMSYRLVNKILHEPTLRLKQEAANGNGAIYISTMRQLFLLDETHSQIMTEDRRPRTEAS